MSTSKPKYYIRYHDEVMTAGEFARRLGLSYDVLRKRMANGEDITAPFEQRVYREPETGKTHGYTIEELAKLYSRFRGDEEELQILADFACTTKREAVKLRKRILEYLDKGVYGK